MDNTVLEVIKYLREIGDALALQGYALALKQMQYHVVMNIFWLVFGLLMFVRALSAGINIAKTSKEEGIDNDVIVMGLAIFALVGFFISFFTASTLIQIWMNPDWYAIKLIINAIKY